MTAQLDATSELQTEVIVVGGGPVGLTLAHELGSRDIEVVLVEPRTAPDASSPRCKQVNPRSMEHYRRLGVAQDVRAHSLLPFGWSDSTVFCTSLAGRQVHRFDGVFALSDVTRDELPEPAQWTAQNRLEAALRSALPRRETVTALWGCRLVDIEESADGVVATTVDADGRGRRIHGRYLAGSDGGRSSVRRLLGIPLSGRSHQIRNLQVVFDAPGLAESHRHGPAVQYWVLNPQVGGLLGRLDTDDAWWAIIIDAPEDAPLGWVEVALRTMVGADTPIRIRSQDPWTARMLVADRYSAGRSFLLGDAAHLNPPWGGFGANTGIGDAVDLGWKLAATVSGWGGMHLLDSYAAERRPIAVRAIAEAEANMAVLTPELASPALDDRGAQGDRARAAATEAVRRAKTSEFYTLGFVLGSGSPDSPIVVPDDRPAPTSTTSDYQPSAAPGRRLPHLWRDRDTSLYDLLGSGLTLIEVATDPAPPTWRRAADRRGVPWTPLQLSEAEALFAARYVLVRPDHLVAWRGDELPADPELLLDRVLGGPVGRSRKTPTGLNSTARQATVCTRP